MFRRKSPMEYWDRSLSRLGWSVLDDRLVEARTIRDGKRWQLRFMDDDGFPFPDGMTQDQALELEGSERWQLGGVIVDVASGGTRVATVINPTFGFLLDNNHGELILYRIAHGMLFPVRELVETLAQVPALRSKLSQIDLARVWGEVEVGRVPTAEEFGETSAEFLKRAVQREGIEAVVRMEESPDDVVEVAVESLKRMVGSNPFRLDGAPYLKGGIG